MSKCTPSLWLCAEWVAAIVITAAAVALNFYYWHHMGGLWRDEVNFDIFWLKDESLEESANLPAPEIIAREIAGDLEAALE